MKIVLAVLVLVSVVAGCGGESEKKPDEPRAFDVRGRMALTDTDGFVELGDAGGTSTGTVCAGSGGYDDITEGVQVVVRNSKGEKIALGELARGLVSTEGQCTFRFNIEDVPASSGLYSIEVSHRGEITFKESDSDRLELTLG